jgi:ribosome-associated protein
MPDRPTDLEPMTEWAVLAARTADDKFGTDTVVIDVGDVLAVTELFVITTGANRRQVRSIVDEIEEQLTKAGGPKPRRVEGLDKYEWVLMDYGEFVVHVFDEPTRAFYRLERLWGDRPFVSWKVA